VKICIIIPKVLPVPNVKGGAIETLVNKIIDQNEIKKELDITITSLYDEEAEKESKKYKYTKFIFIKNDIRYKLKALSVRIKNLFGAHLNTYNEIILDKIKNNNYDYIVVEDGAYHSFKSYLKYFRKEQMLLHFHHVGNSDEQTDLTFGKFIGVSDYVCNEFKKTSNIKNFVTLHNGIDINDFKEDISIKECLELRKKIGFNKNDFIIIFCGRLVEVKGILELIKAVKEIKNQNIKLVIVGSINFGIAQTSEYLENIKSEIFSSNGRIVLTGYVKNTQLYKYYKMADIGVTPSTYEEAALLVGIEMMSCGLPNIITNSGGMVEYASNETIILEKENNLIQNLKDAIIDLYNDKNKREKISKSGIKQAQNFTIEKFYDEFVGIIRGDKNE